MYVITDIHSYLHKHSLSLTQAHTQRKSGTPIFYRLNSSLNGGKGCTSHFTLNPVGCPGCGEGISLTTTME